MDISVYKLIHSKFIVSSERNVPLLLNSASGHNIRALGKATVKMFINNRPYNTEFVLTSGFKFNILIGSDFIYKNNIKFDFANNTMLLDNKVICLKPKSELSNISLLHVTSTQRVEPYSVAHIEVRSKKINNPDSVGINDKMYIITPVNTHKLFYDQPGVVSPSVAVNYNHERIYQIPVINNTGIRHTVSSRTVLGTLELIKNNSIKQSMDVCNIDDFVDTNLHAHVDNNMEELNIGDEISAEQQIELHDLLKVYEDLFARSDRNLTRTNVMQAHLDTGDSMPIKQRPYRNPLALESKLNEQIEEMLQSGIVSHSSSPWSSPVVMVPKRDGTQRVCIDYRRLNQTLRNDSFPLPRIDDLFAILGKAKYFSCLDLKSGYHQIEIVPEDREKTAFCTRTQLLEFNRLPFGLSCGPSLFQRLMSIVLKGIEGKYALAYLDDIMIFSESFEEHIEHLKDVFERLRDANLVLNKKKCHFIKEKIEYLGHIISRDGIQPNPEKVRAIQTLDPPTTVRGVRSYLGMVGYFRQYIQGFSELARPLTRLTKKHVKFEWTEIEQNSFEVLRQKLIEAPILGYPDLNRPYSLYTDASDYAIGGILTQDFEEGERVIQYVSHQLTPNRLHYATIEKEAYAVIYCITKLKQYVLGADVTVYTDHQPLKSLFTAEMKNTRIQRWAILIDEYKIKIKYRRGIHNQRADMLSRIKIKPTAEEIEESKNILAIEEQVSEDNKILSYEDVKFDENVNITDLQNQDVFCKQIISDLKNDKHTQDYVLHDNVLYHIAKLIRFETEPILQLVIPHFLQKLVIEGYHSAIIGGGHVGLEKTYQKIRCKYFWQNCYKDVVEYVFKCEVCQMRNMRRQRAELCNSENPQSPLECVGIDTCGPFATSQNGNNYLVTMVDWYSSWPEAYPIPNKESDTIAKVIMEQFIPRYGCPRRLVSDRGTEYVNSAIDLLSTSMKIKRKVTTPYHPQGNSRTERFHRFLNDIIAKGLQGRMHDEWEQIVPMALFAVRTSVNDSSRFTPYLLMHGRDPIFPLDSLLTPRRRYYGEEYVPTMLQRLHIAFLHVSVNTKSARESYQAQANKRANQRKFLEGDPVYLHDPVVKIGQTKKFRSPWKPYYRIVEMVTPVTAVIRNQQSGNSRIAHVNNLRYAHVDDKWDGIQDPGEFPKQVTTKLLKPSRIQPSRATKLMTRSGDHFTDYDSESSSDDDSIFETLKPLTVLPTSTGNTNIAINVQTTESDDNKIQNPPIVEANRYNLRSRTVGPPSQDSMLAQANTDVSHGTSEDDESKMSTDRRDSSATVIYDPDELMQELKVREKRPREDSDSEPESLPSKRAHTDVDENVEEVIADADMIDIDDQIMFADEFINQDVVNQMWINQTQNSESESELSN